MDPKLADLVGLLVDEGMLDADTASLLADLASAPAEVLLSVREHLRVAVAGIETIDPTDRDIEKLTACAEIVKAVHGEFARRNGDHDRRRATARQLAAALTSSEDDPEPPPSLRLPSISHLAQRTPRTHRPLARRGGPTVLNAAGEPVGEDLTELLGRQIEREWRDRAQWDDGRERVQLASLRVVYPDERLLGEDEVANGQKVDAVTSPAALVASGGVCSPVAVSYDVMSIGVADRPCRDSLAQFGATRGGLRFILPHTLAQVTADGPAAVWTAANDVTLNNPAAKPHATFLCQQVQEFTVDAITSIVQFGNFQARYFPEQIAQYLETVDAVHARLAESTLLAAINAGSTMVNSGADVLGAASEVLAEIDRCAAAYRFRHRMRMDSPLRVVYPEWLEDLIRADVAREAPGNSGGQSERLALADAEIDRFFTSRALNATKILDSFTGAVPFQGWGVQGAGDLLPWPEKVTVWIYHEGAWMFLDGGELNLGMVRDSVLNRTNDFQMFTETFEKAVFRGHESIALTMDVCPSGKRAALADSGAICVSGS